MSREHRYTLVEGMVLTHARFAEATRRMAYCAQFTEGLASRNPPCLALLGETGAGKTTVVQTWLAQRGEKEREEGDPIDYPGALCIDAVACTKKRSSGSLSGCVA